VHIMLLRRRSRRASSTARARTRTGCLGSAGRAAPPPRLAAPSRWWDAALVPHSCFQSPAWLKGCRQTWSARWRRSARLGEECAPGRWCSRCRDSARQPDTATAPVLTSLECVLSQVAAPTVPAKACSRCGATKPASDFNINKTTSSGLTSHCKVPRGPQHRNLAPTAPLSRPAAASIELQPRYVIVFGACPAAVINSLQGSSSTLCHAHYKNCTRPEHLSIMPLQECIAAAAAERKKQKALVHEPTVAFKVCPVY
jgi:hypothetical protein